MKRVKIFIFGFIFILALTTISCKTKTECENKGHSWIEATCEQAKHCTTCGKIEGEVLEHSWIEATCLSYETCRTCGYIRNHQLGEHQIEEATYLHPAYCKVCEEEFGKRLVCSPKSIEVIWNVEGRFLTKEQYENLDQYLKVYGILEDQTRVELSLKDIEMHQELQDTDSEVYLVLSYNGVECVTNKTFLGLLEVINLDFNQLEIMSKTLRFRNQNAASLYVSTESLRKFAIANGYRDINDYLEGSEWNYPQITKQYNPILEDFVPLLYYTKNGYCFYIENYGRFDGEYLGIHVYQMPKNFVSLGLDYLISTNMYNLYFQIKQYETYLVKVENEVILQVTGNVTTMNLQYFSKTEQDNLVYNVSQFYGYAYVTYQVQDSMYYHFTGNNKYDIIIKITPTTNEYVDIEFSLIEEKIE